MLSPSIPTRQQVRRHTVLTDLILFPVSVPNTNASGPNRVTLTGGNGGPSLAPARSLEMDALRVVAIRTARQPGALPNKNGSARNDRKAHQRRMGRVVQDPLSGHDVVRVPLVVPPGVEIAVVLRERR
jgi:hypothetical protein